MGRVQHVQLQLLLLLADVVLCAARVGAGVGDRHLADGQHVVAADDGVVADPADAVDGRLGIDGALQLDRAAALRLKGVVRADRDAREVCRRTRGR